MLINLHLRVGPGTVVVIIVVIGEVLHGQTVSDDLHGHLAACVMHVVPRRGHIDCAVFHNKTRST
jgi:hypothetical protein